MRHVALAFAMVITAAAFSACDQTPAAQTCTIAAPAPPDWRLVVDGTQLRDGLGRVVFLRGVDAGGRSKFAPYVPFDFDSGYYANALAEYMDHAASWGIDAMRVPFTWAALEGTQGVDDADWLSRFDQLLDAAWARGIFTVLDFHQDVYSEVYCGDGFPGWTVSNPPAPHHDCPEWALEYFNDPDVIAAFDAFWAPDSTVQPAYVAAWDRMIARYKDKPGVVGFEPINEPGWGSANESTFSATTLTDFYSMMVPHMRGLAPTSLVFVDPTGLDGNALSTALQPPAGDGFVFAPHFYPLATNPDAVLGDLQAWANVGAAWNVPVFVGEFGLANFLAAAPAYVAGVLAAFDTLGFSGTEWEYSVSVDSWNSESYSIVASDGTEFPVAQSLVRPFARAVAGDSITQSFDSTGYALSYAPSGTSATEIQLPSRAFPNGYRVALAGGCYDTSSEPGRMLVQADPGVAQVSLSITPD